MIVPIAQSASRLLVGCLVAVLSLSSLPLPDRGIPRERASGSSGDPLKVTMSFSRGGVRLPAGTVMDVEICVDYLDKSEAWPSWSDRYNRTRLKLGLNGTAEWQLPREYLPSKVLSYSLVAWFDDLEGGWPFRRWWTLPLQFNRARAHDGILALSDVPLVELPLVEAGWLTGADGEPLLDSAVRISGARVWAMFESESELRRFLVNRHLLRHVMGLCDQNNYLSSVPTASRPRGRADVDVDHEGRFRIFRLPYMEKSIELDPISSKGVIHRLSVKTPSFIDRMAQGSVQGSVEIPQGDTTYAGASVFVAVLAPPFGNASTRPAVDSRPSSDALSENALIQSSVYIHSPKGNDGEFEFLNLPTSQVSIFLMGSGGLCKRVGTFQVTSGKKTVIPKATVLGDNN